jgi:hypothetical protein
MQTLITRRRLRAPLSLSAALLLIACGGVDATDTTSTATSSLGEASGADGAPAEGEARPERGDREASQSAGAGGAGAHGQRRTPGRGGRFRAPGCAAVLRSRTGRCWPC